MRWNAASGIWEPQVIEVTNVAPLATGSIWHGDANNVAQELPIGTAHQVLTVDPASGLPAWSSSLSVDSVYSRTLNVAEGTTLNGGLIVNANTRLTGNIVVDGSTELNGTVVAGDSVAFNGPARFAQFPEIGLEENALVVGDATNTASPLPSTNTSGAVLQQDINGVPVWSRNLNVDVVDATSITTTGPVVVGGNLTVNGTAVNLPAGSVDNTELENSSINLNYGTGISGDASVALGGTLNLQNTGVTSITGTANQVVADQATGDVTLSLPQDIHTDAVPTFDGATLDNLTASSTSQDLVVSNAGSLETRTFGSLHPGGILPFGTTNNSTLRWDGTGWVENATVTADNTGNLTTSGNVNVGGNAIVTGDLTVNGTAVNLPAGSVDNTELENSSINLNYGTGISGDANVALGGTLNLQNTGVTEASAGTGIAVDQATGTVTISNTGVTSITGTANQVIADQATGDVTLSLPQDIHTDAVPTFDGATLDNLTASSTSQDLVVSNAGSLETRAFGSLHPGGILPFGTTNNSTLRWDGTGWVENATVTADNTGNLTTSGNVNVGGNTTVTGDLTVNGTAVNLPAGSVDNTELENSSINLNYGTGISGDASVALGGTLNLQNTGVTSITGTANQVIPDQATGDVTLSLPQDIHTDAVPTFDGATLDNLTASSTSQDLVVSNAGSLETRTFGSLHPGGILPFGTTNNSTLRWDGTGWVENATVTADNTGNITTSGSVNVGGNTTVTGNLTVNGTAVSLPAGSVDNTELENSSINLNYGTGISGDANVALGGTLNVQNTGVTEATAGTGIAVDQATGTVTISNTGVTSITGTANQVIPDQATGDVTLSLPQDIHTDAVPTFDGATLDNLTASSTSQDLVVSNAGSLETRTFSSLHPGGILPFGTTNNSTLRWDGTGWVENTTVTADNTGNLTTSGNVNVGGNATVTGNLTVNGTAVNLPAGSVDNTELENSSINLNYGTGISGDANVALGGTLNLQNTGVTEASAGTGIAVDQATGTVTISNTGVTSITGTANQVIPDQATGDVTLSLPQDIHTDAVPTFDGATLDNLTASSTSQDLVVSNAGSLETRTFSSLHPGGILPFGTTNNSTLRWDGTGWVENATVTADNTGNLTTSGNVNVGGNATVTGNLTVNGTAVNLPAGSVDNTELENSSINLNYGTGISGDANVALGGTLNLQNTGVTEASAGTGIAVDQATGTVTISNTGVTSITGTANQVIADQATGDVTLSLPQDIHTDAVPTFDGATLDNLTASSTSQNIVVSNAGSLETRTVASLASEFNDVFWTTSGNTGTTPGTHFIGTTDNQAFEIHVNDNAASGTNAYGRVMRFQPNSITVGIVGGHPSNAVTGTGGTISGGGSNGRPNTISGTFGTIGGGRGNQIGLTGSNVIAGGEDNTIGDGAYRAAIVGGQGIVLENDVDNSFAGAGRNNRISYGSVRSFIGSGSDNEIDTNAWTSFIGTGTENYIGGASRNSFVGAGIQNRIENSALRSFIGTGEENTIAANSSQSFIGGGYQNSIESDAPNSTIVNGERNTVLTGSESATIGGGQDNTVNGNNTTIAGGSTNSVTGNHATVGGGLRNSVSFFAGTIAGGIDNVAVYQATVGGGARNEARGSAATIAGGYNNETTFATAIGGGGFNYGGYYSAIPGGRGLTIGARSFGFLGGNSSNPSNASSAGDNPMSISDDDVAVFGNVDMWLANNNGNASALRFYESETGTGSFPSGTHFTSFQARDQAADIQYLLPDSAGIIGDVLSVASVSGTQVTLDWISAGIIVSDSAWSLTGNAGTTPGTNFVGTTDAQALHVYVNGGADNSLILNTNGSLQRDNAGNARGTNAVDLQISRNASTQVAAATQSFLGGGSDNTIESTAPQSVIAGGDRNTISDDHGVIGGGGQNSIASDYGVIGGGQQNVIETGRRRAVIGGGFQNSITSSGESGTISGGRNNTVSGDRGVIGGGQSNTVSESYTTIAGGSINTVQSSYSTVSGGTLNEIQTAAGSSTISGGESNTIASSGSYTVIAGGESNTISDDHSVIGGGEQNSIASDYGVIGGGQQNVIETGRRRAVIGGGFQNSITSSGESGTISGGRNNTVSGDRGVIGGGQSNTVSESYTTIAGGSINTVQSSYSTVSGGTLNEIQTAAGSSTISGGESNTIASNGSYTVIAGGESNTISDDHGVIGGGRQNSIASDYGVIGGGQQNVIETGRRRAVIGGGFQNSISSSGESGTISGGRNNTVSGERGVIGGGQSNTASANYTTIAGGNNNTVSGERGVIGGGQNNTASANYTTIAGGNNNTVQSSYSTVSGGTSNEIQTGASRSTISGGESNTITSNSSYTVIAGGQSNSISDDHGVIGGGQNNDIQNGAAHSTIGGGLGNVVSGEFSAIPGGRELTLSGSESFGFLSSDAGNTPMTVSADETAVFGNTDLWLANNNNAASQLRFYEAETDIGAFPSTTHYSSFEARNQGADIQYLLPDSAGIVGDVLTVASVSGSQVTLDWDAVSAGTSINVSDSAWSRTGNAGTTAGTDFLGTTDNQAFQIHVDHGNTTGTDGRGRVMRFEPNATSANIIGGFQGNSVAGGIVGATIAGGGLNGEENTVDANYSTVSGGRNNSIAASLTDGTIGGGYGNAIDGTADRTTIGGGYFNFIGSNTDDATISGGTGNYIAAGSGANVIGGGLWDSIGTASYQATIGGGALNIIGSNSHQSTIAGGRNNVISDSSPGTTIAGGLANTLTGRMSTIAGGRELTLEGDGSIGFLANESGNFDMSITADEAAIFGNTDLWLANNDNAASQLRFYEANSSTGAFPSGTNYTAFVAGSQSADITYTLPTDAPTADGQVMTSTTGGTMSWASELTLSNSSSTVATMQLENTDASGTALEVVDGNTILSYGSGTNATIPDDVTVWVVDDNSVAATGVTAALPTAGSDGQFLYVLYNDADNGTVGGNAVANGDRLTFIHANGGWVLWHVN